jgi:hypothetical protein
MIYYELLLVAAIHAIEGSHVRVLQVIKDSLGSSTAITRARGMPRSSRRQTQASPKMP